MAIPEPEPGLVVSYAYVWDYEAQRGQEEGRKVRPCVLTLVTERQTGGEKVVTVLPVTHSPPADPAAAVEIPHAVKRHLGLDNQRSWIIVSEGDRFVWPGYDLSKIAGSGSYDYGFLPPRFFDQVLAAFLAWHRAHRVKLISR